MQMRNIYKLIDALKAEVPKDDPDYNRVIKALDNVADSAKYRAPEAYGVNFDQLARTLQNVLGIPRKTWQKNIRSIFNGQIDVPNMTYVEVP